MQLETKFLRLRTPVTLGSRFGDWHVTWLGGWSKYRLFYLVMMVKIQPLRAHRQKPSTRLAPSSPGGMVERMKLINSPAVLSPHWLKKFDPASCAGRQNDDAISRGGVRKYRKIGARDSRERR
jgi:hypothetical protein